MRIEDLRHELENHAEYVHHLAERLSVDGKPLSTHDKAVIRSVLVNGRFTEGRFFFLDGNVDDFNNWSNQLSDLLGDFA